MKSSKIINIKGNVANSFQLIGVVAGKYKLKEKYENVFLCLNYYNYWGRQNIPDEFVQYIENSNNSCIPGRKISVNINHARRFGFRRIVVDDGVGAYRKNPIAHLQTLNSEKIHKGEKKTSLFRSIKFVIRFLLNQLNIFFPVNNVSIFKKKWLGYFDVDEGNIKYFKKALMELSALFVDHQQISEKSIIFASQPALISQNKKEYIDFLGVIFAKLRKDYPFCPILVKKHPIDDIDYSIFDIGEIKDDLPMEIFLTINESNIYSVFGFSSTSLLTAKILSGINAYYILPLGHKKLTNDFWVNRCFKLHLQEYKLN